MSCPTTTIARRSPLASSVTTGKHFRSPAQPVSIVASHGWDAFRAKAALSSPVRHRVWVWRRENDNDSGQINVVNDSAWIEDPDLIAEGDVIQTIGPEMGTASIVHHFGEVRRLRDKEYKRYTPDIEDLPWRYVKITAEQVLDFRRADAKPIQVPIFYGVVINGSHSPDGLFTSYALADFRYLLQGIKNERGWFECQQLSQGTPCPIGTFGKLLKDNAIFNDKLHGPDGPSEEENIFLRGNRSAKKFGNYVLGPDLDDFPVIVPGAGDDMHAAYVFSMERGTPWTYRDMFDYFMALYIRLPRNAPKDFPVEWHVIGAEKLDTICTPEDYPDGANTAQIVKQKWGEMDLVGKDMVTCLDQIIRSAGDFTWILEVKEPVNANVEESRNVATIEFDAAAGNPQLVNVSTTTGLDVADLKPGMMIYGPGIPPQTFILTIDSSDELTMTKAATSDETNQPGKVYEFVGVRETAQAVNATIRIVDKSDAAGVGKASFAEHGYTSAMSFIWGIQRGLAVINPDPQATAYVPSVGPINYNESARVNRLVVLGARRRFMTTIAPWRLDHCKRPSAGRGWKQEDEDDMLLFLGVNQEGENPNKEAEERWDEVFRRFIVSEAFQFEDVEELKSADPDAHRPIITPFYLNPKPFSFGRIETQVNLPSHTPDDYIRWMRTGATTYAREPRPLHPKLPIRTGYDYTSNPPVKRSLIQTPIGVGEFMKSLCFSINVDPIKLEVVRDFTAIPPMKRIRDFHELEDSCGVKHSHYNHNNTDNFGSAGIDFTGYSEIQDSVNMELLWPYDLVGGIPNDTKIRGKHFQAYKTLCWTVCLEADDRPYYIVEDAASLARGDAPRTMFILNEEFHYWEAREALIDDTALLAEIKYDGDGTTQIKNVSSVSGLSFDAIGKGMAISGAGIPENTHVVSNDGGGKLTLTQGAAADVQAEAKIYGPLVIGKVGEPYVLRNDFDHLRSFSNRLFRKLRSQKRDGFLHYGYIDFTFRPGDWVGVVRDQATGDIRAEVNAIVSSVSWNLQDQVTVVKTQYDIQADIEEIT